MFAGAAVRVTEQEMKSKRCQGNSSLINIVIPGSVGKIMEFTFTGCKNLRSVTIEQGVQFIEAGAFKDCCNLIEIHIPQSIRLIACDAFANCTGLKIIRVDMKNPSYSDRSGVLYDGKGQVLYYCPKGYTGALTVPEGVCAIHMDAFNGCRQLTSVSLPSSLRYWACHQAEDFTSSYGISQEPQYNERGNCFIDDWRFDTCYVDLRYKRLYVEAPSGDGSFQRNRPMIFVGCDSLEAITSASPHLTAADGVLYEEGEEYYEGEWLLRYPPARKGSFTFSERVGGIEPGAFADCRFLKEITIPKTLRTLSLKTHNIKDDKVPINGVLAEKCLSECKTLTDLTLDKRSRSNWLEQLAKTSHVNLHYYTNMNFYWHRCRGYVIFLAVLLAVCLLLCHFVNVGVALLTAVLGVVLTYFFAAARHNEHLKVAFLIFVFAGVFLTALFLALHFWGQKAASYVIFGGIIVGIVLYFVLRDYI